VISANGLKARRYHWITAHKSFMIDLLAAIAVAIIQGGQSWIAPMINVQSTRR
jgi:hypothetical protein